MQVYYIEGGGHAVAFCSLPGVSKRENVIFKIDNLAVLYKWYKGYVAKDKSASEKLKSVHYLSGILETTVNVEHVDPASNEMAELADELSRKTVSSNRSTMKALASVDQWVVKGYILKWLENPATGISLCRELVKEIRENCP